MLNIYQSHPAKIIKAEKLSADTILLRLAFCQKKIQSSFAFIPGQFVQVGLNGWGECPISICSSSKNANSFFELAVRDVGQLTHQINSLKIGDFLQIRGPFGNGFGQESLTGRNLLLIGGGCGFVPLRSLILDYMFGVLKLQSLKIFYGCLNEDSILFKKEQADWNRQAELSIILDRPTDKWQGQRGLVTDLIKKNKLSEKTTAVLVGPPIMYRFAVKELLSAGLKSEDIFLSLERKMYCGVGVCQHCAIGPYYVCKDGPVFSYTQLKDIPNAI